MPNRTCSSLDRLILSARKSARFPFQQGHAVDNFCQTRSCQPHRHWCAICLFIAALSGCRMVSQGRNVDGVRYFQQGQYPVAIQRFDAALTMDPRNADSYYNKAAVYHRMGLAARDQNQLTQAESL